jgi:NADH dehydrogenase
MTTVLVTGASGFVGSHVVPELLTAGHRVVALVRSPKAGETITGRLPAALAAGVEIRLGDVLDPASLPAALAGVDAVVHLVALPRDWNGGKDLLRVNLGGTQNVIAAMEAAGVRRLVHLGALGVADREELHYAKSKARAEAAVRASGLDWTILRPSLLFGPRDGFFNIVAGLVRIPVPVVPVPGNGKSRFQPLHVGDLALCARLAVERPATIGQAYELGGPRTWTYREITREVARALGKRRVIVPMPLPLIRLVAGTMEALHLRFFPVATDQLRQLALDNVGPLDSVHGAFGFVPRTMEGELHYLRRPKREQEPAPAV